MSSASPRGRREGADAELVRGIILELKFVADPIGNHEQLFLVEPIPNSDGKMAQRMDRPGARR